MQRIDSDDTCQIGNCHRHATWCANDGTELCSTCARRHPEWDEAAAIPAAAATGEKTRK